MSPEVRGRPPVAVRWAARTSETQPVCGLLDADPG
jgi:hypothetical protein